MTNPDHEQPRTILSRMTAALGEDKARAWLESGHVQVAGERVTDPGTVVPDGVGWVINPQ